jgi:hypothetical protein
VSEGFGLVLGAQAVLLARYRVLAVKNARSLKQDESLLHNWIRMEKSKAETDWFNRKDHKDGLMDRAIAPRPPKAKTKRIMQKQNEPN